MLHEVTGTFLCQHTVVILFFFSACLIPPVLIIMMDEKITGSAAFFGRSDLIKSYLTSFSQS